MLSWPIVNVMYGFELSFIVPGCITCAHLVYFIAGDFKATVALKLAVS